MSHLSVRVVMVRTFQSENIGAVARAMKNMGLNDLVLVAPRDWPSDVARNRAAGAVDVLDNIALADSVEEAIADCHWVVATSARRRGYEWPMSNARQSMSEAYRRSQEGQQVAILLGPERSGLDSDSLRLCDQHCYISANPDYPVLNVAQAAQVLTYELYQASEAGGELPETPDSNRPRYPKHEAVEHFYQHLESALTHIGFLRPEHPGDTLVKLRRLLTKAQIEDSELNMLRGILSAIERLERP